MSKENAKKFLDDLNKDDILKKQLFDSNAQTWVTVAKKNGYEMSVEDLADGLIGTIRTVVSGELDEGSLDAVTGGAGTLTATSTKTTPLLLRPIAVNRQQLDAAKLKAAARW